MRDGTLRLDPSDSVTIKASEAEIAIDVEEHGGIVLIVRRSMQPDLTVRIASTGILLSVESRSGAYLGPEMLAARDTAPT